MKTLLTDQQRAILEDLLAPAAERIKREKTGIHALVDHLSAKLGRNFAPQNVYRWSTFRRTPENRHEPGLAIGWPIMQWGTEEAPRKGKRGR